MTAGRGFIVLIVCSLAFAIHGCPDSSTATDWESQHIDTGSSTVPVAVRVADMDKDGRNDVVTLWKGTDSGNTGAVVISYHDENDVWTNAPINSDEFLAEANAISIADINGDKHPDVLVAAGDRLRYLRAPENPRNTSEWVAYNLTESIKADYDQWYDVAAADIDGKNGLDIVATLKDVGRLVWFASPENPDSADGWKLRSIDSTTRAGADSVQILDMDGDHDLDVVCSATGDNSGAISWYEHEADPTKEPWKKHIMTSFGGATRFAFGDLNGDGAIDMAAISPTKRQVAWFPRPSSVRGVWNGWLMVNYTKSTSDKRVPVDIAIADMNGDGQQDVVVACTDPGCVFWYTPGTSNQALWTANRVFAFADVDAGFIATDDVNGDGLPDVIVPIDHQTDDSLDRIDWFVNAGAQ